MQTTKLEALSPFMCSCIRPTCTTGINAPLTHSCYGIVSEAMPDAHLERFGLCKNVPEAKSLISSTRDDGLTIRRHSLGPEEKEMNSISHQNSTSIYAGIYQALPT